jgi:methane/ammonia monooxygenase subunit A
VTPAAARVARALEWATIPAVVFVLAGTFHLHYMLTAGDWDFWLDWKDREWWVTVSPVMAIMFCGAAHAILWENFRLPFGATLVVTLLTLAEWVVRVLGWHGWSHYPINLITPAYFTAGALAMDAILLLSRSWVLTGIFGASLFGLLFFPSNWAWLGAFHVPAEVNGLVVTLADLIGFENIRTGTPEYIRIIERGTLRTFGQHSTPVSAFFAAFLCSVTYWVWWFIGKAFCTLKYVKGRL